MLNEQQAGDCLPYEINTHEHVAAVHIAGNVASLESVGVPPASGVATVMQQAGVTPALTGCGRSGRRRAN
jgi:hypothetical protein